MDFMSKLSLCLLGGFLFYCSSVLANEPEGTKLHVSSFDRKEYATRVKAILRYKHPSFIRQAAKTVFKEILYLAASGALGAGVINSGSEKDQNAYAQAFLVAAVSHSIMRLLFDYLCLPRDENLKNLESLEKYMKETLSSDDIILNRESDLLLKIFEKDFDIISKKLDQEYGAGFLRRLIRWIFDHQIFFLESAAFGTGAAIFSDSMGPNGLAIGICMGIFYYIVLVIVFDLIISREDQRLLKIEKFRDIIEFVEEIKHKKTVLQVQPEAL